MQLNDMDVRGRTDTFNCGQPSPVLGFSSSALRLRNPKFCHCLPAVHKVQLLKEPWVVSVVWKLCGAVSQESQAWDKQCQWVNADLILMPVLKRGPLHKRLRAHQDQFLPNWCLWIPQIDYKIVQCGPTLAACRLLKASRVV